MATYLDGVNEGYKWTTNDGKPFSLAAWYYVQSWPAGPLQEMIVCYSDVTWDDEWATLDIQTSGLDHYLRASERDGGFENAVATAQPSLQTWQHGLAVFAGVNSRYVYLNGANKAINSNNVDPNTYDVCAIGSTQDNTPGEYFNGRIAEVGVWDIALTDADAAMLAAGYSPLFVKPQNLIYYIQCVRNVIEYMQNTTLTTLGTPDVIEHPIIRYPAKPYAPLISAGVVPQIQLLRNMGVVA